MTAHCTIQLELGWTFHPNKKYIQLVSLFDLTWRWKEATIPDMQTTFSWGFHSRSCEENPYYWYLWERYPGGLGSAGCRWLSGQDDWPWYRPPVQSVLLVQPPVPYSSECTTVASHQSCHLYCCTPVQRSWRNWRHEDVIRHLFFGCLGTNE